VVYFLYIILKIKLLGGKMSFNCVKKVEDDYDKYVLVSTTGKINLPDYLDKKSKDLAKAVIEKNEFTAKASEKLAMTLVNNKKVIDFVIVGLGDKAKLDCKNIRQYLFDTLKNETGKVLLSFANEELDNMDIVVELGKQFGFQAEIMDEKKIQKLGMNAYLGVARAAHHRPYLIVMRYKGDEKSKYTHGLVGKGLTYDTGGLSLKPTASMLTMRCDMGGAGTMMGVMCAVAKMKVKKNVTCVIAACENSIGPNAYRPGDILTAMNGKTIEITNTDAEGRLTLADALTYIVRKEKVDEIIDAATLTGAVMVALGEDVTGVFTNNDEMAKEIISASNNWNEYFWQMPMFDIFKKNFKSPYADMQNSGSRWGGSTNAAKFLEEFIDDTKWTHLDIAGTAWASGANPYYSQKGATGQVFRTVFSYLKNSKN